MVSKENTENTVIHVLQISREAASFPSFYSDNISLRLESQHSLTLSHPFLTALPVCFGDLLVGEAFQDATSEVAVLIEASKSLGSG